jgi:hypothetical protein
MRRTAGGVLLSPADVERSGGSGLEAWAEWLSPMSRWFKLLGIFMARPNVSRDIYLSARPERVHLDERHGQVSTYSPEKNPFYKAAFLYDAAMGADADSGVLLRPADMPACLTHSRSASTAHSCSRSASNACSPEFGRSPRSCATSASGSPPAPRCRTRSCESEGPGGRGSLMGAMGQSTASVLEEEEHGRGEGRQQAWSHARVSA